MLRERRVWGLLLSISAGLLLFYRSHLGTDRLGPHQHRSWKGEGTKIQRGQSLHSELAHPQEAARQASGQWSKGMTSSDWARLFGYLSSGRSPDDNTQNQAWFQVIRSVTAGPRQKLRRKSYCTSQGKGAARVWQSIRMSRGNWSSCQDPSPAENWSAQQRSWGGLELQDFGQSGKRTQRLSFQEEPDFQVSRQPNQFYLLIGLRLMTGSGWAQTDGEQLKASGTLMCIRIAQGAGYSADSDWPGLSWGLDLNF